MQKDAATASFFTFSENSTRIDETILWQRTENCPNCFAENYEIAEKLILENPQFVYFGSKKTVSGLFKHYPCHIVITSASLARVIICYFSPSRQCLYIQQSGYFNTEVNQEFLNNYHT